MSAIAITLTDFLVIKTPYFLTQHENDNKNRTEDKVSPYLSPEKSN